MVVQTEQFKVPESVTVAIQHTTTTCVPSFGLSQEQQQASEVVVRRAFGFYVQ